MHTSLAMYCCVSSEELGLISASEKYTAPYKPLDITGLR